MARERKIKRAKERAKEREKNEGRLGERTRERLWNFLKGSRSGIPDSGIPSDWSILTPSVNTQASSTQTRNAIWRCVIQSRNNSLMLF